MVTYSDGLLEQMDRFLYPTMGFLSLGETNRVFPVGVDFARVPK